MSTASGTVAAADVTNIAVACTSPWVWIGGSQSTNASAVYGVLGVAAAGNTPGARTGAATWVDGTGNIWIFGGSDVTGTLGDLWQFAPATGLWTWEGGPMGHEVAGVYGVQGTADPANSPGSRSAATTWTDTSGNFWLFGGFGNGIAAGSDGQLNDLWQFSPGSGEWTWVGGTSTAYSTTASGSYGIEGASDPTNLPPARSAAAAWRDTAGNLWLFGGVGVAPTGSASPSQLGLMNDLWLYEPTTGLWTWVNGSNQTVPDGSYSAVYGTLGVAAPGNLPTARAGANAWSDASGNLWLFGGQYAVIGQGTPALNDLWEYNPTTNLWTWMSGSTPGSDYSLTSPSGGGTYGSEGTAAAANTPGERWGGGAWTDAIGKFWLFGGVTPGTNPDICCSVSNDLWSYDPATGEWTWVSGSMVSGSTPAGTYGAIGVGNVLAGRANPVMAGDGNGNLWIYGGSAWQGNRDDLWRFSLPQ